MSPIRCLSSDLICFGDLPSVVHWETSQNKLLVESGHYGPDPQSCVGIIFLMHLWDSVVPLATIIVRVPTPPGKQGKWWKVIPDRENTGNLKMLEKTQGKHREFENIKREIQYQENNCRKKYCMTLIQWHLKFKLFILLRKSPRENWNYNVRENTENFVSQDEWEP